MEKMSVSPCQLQHVLGRCKLHIAIVTWCLCLEVCQTMLFLLGNCRGSLQITADAANSQVWISIKGFTFRALEDMMNINLDITFHSHHVAILGRHSPWASSLHSRYFADITQPTYQQLR